MRMFLRNGLQKFSLRLNLDLSLLWITPRTTIDYWKNYQSVYGEKRIFKNGYMVKIFYSIVRR